MKNLLCAIMLAVWALSCGAADPVESVDEVGVDAGGSGGSGDALPISCTYAVDCPGPDERSTCVHRVCDAGTCGLWYAPAGRREQEDLIRGDCAAFECDGAGAFIRVEDPTDAHDDGRECTVDSCDGFSFASVSKPAGTECSVGACDGRGNCVGAQASGFR